MALMYDEFGRGIQRLKASAQQAAVGKISGAVGTHAHLNPDVEHYICQKLGIQASPISTQVIQRDIHADFMNTLALIAASIERWSTEFRHLQRTEVLEAEEYFSNGQKGSSAMPHKRNPITGERLTGLARVIRGNALAAMENIALWHERDISHSSVERIIFPDSCTLLDYMLHKLNQLVAGLIVYPENMQRNMKLTLGMWHSQTVMLELVKKGLTREAAYAIVQRNAMETWKARHDGTLDADFKDQLLSDPDIARLLTRQELDSICNLDFHLRFIDQKFKALGIDP
jgi:adenylosuccinate lyase